MGPETKQPPTAPERKPNEAEALKTYDELEATLKKLPRDARVILLQSAIRDVELDLGARNDLYSAFFEDLPPLPTGADDEGKLAFAAFVSARLAVLVQAQKVKTAGKAAVKGLTEAIDTYSTASFDYHSKNPIEDVAPKKPKPAALKMSEMEGLLLVMGFDELQPGQVTDAQRQLDAERSTILRMLKGGRSALPPLPAGADPALMAQWEAIDVSGNTISDYLIILNERGVLPADIEVLRKAIRGYERDCAAYLQAREAMAPGIVDRVLLQSGLPADKKPLLNDVIQGYAPTAPTSPVGDVRKHYQNVYDQYLALWRDCHQLSIGNVLKPDGGLPDKVVSSKPPVNAADFRVRLDTYAKAKAEYDKVSLDALLPFVKTALREALKAKGGVDFTAEECTLLLQELQKPLPQPPTNERLAPQVRDYFRGQYEGLEALRSTALFQLWYMQVKTDAKKPVSPQTYADFTEAATRFLVLSDEYAEDVGKARPPDSLLKKTAKLSGAIVLLHQAQKGVNRILPPRPDFIPPGREKELRIKYDKLLEEFKAKPGVDLRTFPTFEKMFSLEKTGLVRGAGAEIWKAVSHLGPTELVLLSLVMYMSRDKIKGGTEFMLAMGAIGMVNAGAMPFERRALRQAMRGKTSLAGRAFTRVKGPWFVKAAAVVGILIAGEKTMDDVGEWMSDGVRHNGARKFVEDFGHSFGGPIFDKIGAVPNALGGLDPTGSEPALAFLIEKRSSPIIQKYCRSPQEFNALVERAIRLGSHEMSEFYRLEKVDLADDYRKDVDVSQPLDPAEIQSEGSFNIEYGDWRSVKDWRASRFVSRMALRSRATHGILAAEQAQLQAFVESKELNVGTVPSLGDFVCDPRVPVDFESNSVTVTDRLMRAIDGSYSSSSPVAAESKAIGDFSKAVADSGNDELKKYWKAHVKNTAELAEMIGLFRYLQVYDRDCWFEDKEFIARGAISEIEYRQRKKQATLRLGGDVKQLMVGVALVEDLFDSTKMRLPPREKLKRPAGPEGALDNWPVGAVRQDPLVTPDVGSSDLQPVPPDGPLRSGIPLPIQPEKKDKTADDPKETKEVKEVRQQQEFMRAVARQMEKRLPDLKVLQKDKPSAAFVPDEIISQQGLTAQKSTLPVSLRYASLGGKDVVLARVFVRPDTRGRGKLLSVPRDGGIRTYESNESELSVMMAWWPGLDEPVFFYLEAARIPTFADKGADYQMTVKEIFDLRSSPNGSKGDAFDRILRSCSYDVAYANNDNDEDKNYRQILDEKLGALITARKLDFDDPKLLRAFVEAVAAQKYRLTATTVDPILSEIEKKLDAR